MTKNEVVSNLKPEDRVPTVAVEDVRRLNVAPDAIHYRVVADKELELLGPLFTRLGWPPPDPDMAKVIVAEAGEGVDALICGFCVVQFVVHAEPLWMNPDLRGTGVAEGLVEHTQHYIEHDCKIRRYVCVAKPGSFAARLAEKYGMQAWPGQIYVKQTG